MQHAFFTTTLVILKEKLSLRSCAKAVINWKYVFGSLALRAGPNTSRPGLDRAGSPGGPVSQAALKSLRADIKQNKFTLFRQQKRIAKNRKKF